MPSYARVCDVPTPVDLAVVDVSFISLDRILGPVALCFGPLGGRIVCLVKPQFEAGRKQVRDGVVRDPQIHLQTLTTVARYALGIGLKLRNAVASPLTGPAGTREFFLDLEVPAGFAPREGEPGQLSEEWVSKFVELAGA